MTSRRIATSICGALLASALALPRLAFADATPVELVLLYLPSISTTGTTTASGIAELVMPEGEVRITAADLPRLEGDGKYMAWVVNSETNQFQRVGDFNSAETTGAVHYENVLPDAIPNNHWNLLLLTVEDDASADHPSSDHSIAAVFPNGQEAALPGVLPNTGGAPDAEIVSGSWADRLPLAGLLALLFSLGGVAGYGVRSARQPLTH